MSADRPALVRAAAKVAGEGVDPDRLARVVAQVVAPRRGPDAVRRTAAAAGLPPGEALEIAAGSVPAHLGEVTVTLLRDWERLGVRATTVVDAAYPTRLGAGWPDRDAPLVLAWRGEPPADGPAVAIVGSRRATGYGTGVAAWLAGAAAAAGARVVSGGAVGVDAAAHLAALEAPGGTTVVLGCGHAVRYPRSHAGPGGLFDRVVDHAGTLLSEHLPHAAPHPGNVRARNRIVAGLADVVVVVEGGARSGALVTATAAADHGVPVLAVPGDVRAPGSTAPHRLLQEGAGPCTAPADLLDALGRVGTASPTDATAPAAGGDGPATRSVLPADVHRMLAAAWPRPVPVDDLAAATGRPAGSLLGALTRARVAGETADDAAGVRLRRAPADVDGVAPHRRNTSHTS